MKHTTKAALFGAALLALLLLRRHYTNGANVSPNGENEPMNDELLRRLDALEALEAAGLPQDDLSLEDLTASIEGDDGGGKAGEP